MIIKHDNLEELIRSSIVLLRRLIYAKGRAPYGRRDKKHNGVIRLSVDKASLEKKEPLGMSDEALLEALSVIKLYVEAGTKLVRPGKKKYELFDIHIALV